MPFFFPLEETEGLLPGVSNFVGAWETGLDDIFPFVSEYMLPGYPFAAMPEGFKQFYGMMQRDEGVVLR